MKKIWFVVIVALVLLALTGASVAAPPPSGETCFKVDVTDAFKGASGDVSGECPGAYVTSVCVKAATETFCASNACFTINYSGSSWSVSENWSGNDKGPECHDISWYRVCYECPSPKAKCNEACELDTDCEGDLVCDENLCRNNECLTETDCICEVPEAKCNEACELDTDCESPWVCHEGKCRESLCPRQKDCICPVAPAGCNKEPTEAGCKGDLVPYVLPDGRIVCRNSGCLEEPTCICTPPACYPRLNIALNCVPEGLVISGYFEFDKDNLYGPDGKPTGKRYINKPWEKNPFIVDLKKGYAFRFFGWTAEGGFVYFFDVPPIRQCPKTIDEEYRFPCPVPTPTPTPEAPEELPKTGLGPPLATQAAQSGVSFVSLIGLAFMAIGTYLRTRD